LTPLPSSILQSTDLVSARPFWPKKNGRKRIKKKKKTKNRKRKTRLRVMSADMYSLPCEIVEALIVDHGTSALPLALAFGGTVSSFVALVLRHAISRCKARGSDTIVGACLASPADPFCRVACREIWRSSERFRLVLVEAAMTARPHGVRVSERTPTLLPVDCVAARAWFDPSLGSKPTQELPQHDATGPADALAGWSCRGGQASAASDILRLSEGRMPSVVAHEGTVVCAVPSGKRKAVATNLRNALGDVTDSEVVLEDGRRALFFARSIHFGGPAISITVVRAHRPPGVWRVSASIRGSATPWTDLPCDLLNRFTVLGTAAILLDDLARNFGVEAWPSCIVTCEGTFRQNLAGLVDQ
jgi:hypothetical protein